MSRRRLSSANLTTIIITIVGTIGTIVTAYFVYRSNIAPIELALSATRTAFAKITEFTSPISSVNTSAVYPTDILASTATETLSPTLPTTQITESPKPTPDILFSDSFETNANGWELGIRDSNVASRDKRIVDQALQLSVDFHTDGAYGWINVPDFHAEDFYLSIDVEIVQSSSRSKIGIVFLFRLTADGNAAYAIEFDNDGTLVLYSSNTMSKDGRWKLLHSEPVDVLPSLLKEGDINSFAIKVSGQRFTTFVNNMQLFTFEDNTISGIGTIGIGLTGESQKSAIVKFDNLIITK